jgi:relaxin family peptide receptor 2
LLIIAGADDYYRGIYVLHDKTWRESVVCKLAGFLATLSCETSTFFVFVITLDRFVMMKFPFNQDKFSKMSKLILLPMFWLIGFILALTPIVLRYEIYSSNSMCLGLPLTTERLNGWEFSFAVFIVLNFCLFLLIVCGQRAIFQAMSENRTTQTASRRAQDLTVAKKLFLVALSNFLCWFPVGIMGLLTLVDFVISNEVYAWTTVVVLPINSAANPLIYTIPAIMAKWDQFKLGQTSTSHSTTGTAITKL